MNGQRAVNPRGNVEILCRLPGTAIGVTVKSREGSVPIVYLIGRHRRPTDLEEVPVRALPTPPLGGRVQLVFPRSTGRSGHYVVAVVDGGDTITLRPTTGSVDDAPEGTPCFVTYTVGKQRLTTEAITIDCGPAGMVLQLRLADQRRFPRYRRPIAVEIDVPQTELGLVEGVTEDSGSRSIDALSSLSAWPTPNRSWRRRGP
jgi:hypothetical protein